MSNTPEYYKTYYLLQSFLMKLSKDFAPSESTYTQTELQRMTTKLTDQIDKFYEKSI